MPTATQHKLVFALCFVFMFFRPGLAQTDSTKVDGSEEQALMETWHKVYDSIADTLQVRQYPSNSNALSTEGAELNRQTLLTINNPQFQMCHGRVYLWTDNGRPIILNSIASANAAEAPMTRRVTYEFHSLSQNAVSASRDERVFWHCEKPGLTWLDGIEKTTPSDNRAIRLTQMKSIARGFTAAGPANVFRLLPTPIYRYPIETPDVFDGAIFTFSLGTDPCIYLFVEARRNAWHLAFARSNTRELKIKRGEELFLTFEDVSKGYRAPTDPFCLIWTAESRSISDPEKVLFQAALPTPK